MALVAAGYNASQQLGDGHDGSRPVKIPVSAEDLVCVTSGEDHTVFVMRDGTALALGDDEDYAIGTSDRMIYAQPTKVEFGDKKKEQPVIAWAHCGQYYSSYLTNNGELYTCCMFRPRQTAKIKRDIPFVYLSGCVASPCAVDKNGTAWLFKDDPFEPPKQIKLPLPICEIVFGRDIAIAITSDGTAYGNGFLNNDSEEFAAIPSLSDKKCKQAFACDAHGGVVTEDGEVFVVGYGDNGLLGLGEDVTETLEFTKLEMQNKIVMGATGLEHTVLLDEAGQLWGCGYNRDGALFLGPPSEDGEKDTHFVPTQLPIDGKATFVTCGHIQTIALIGAEPPDRLGWKAFTCSNER